MQENLKSGTEKTHDTNLFLCCKQHDYSSLFHDRFNKCWLNYLGLAEVDVNKISNKNPQQESMEMIYFPEIKSNNREDQIS